MNAKQITAVMNREDGADVDGLIAKLRSADEDQILNLLDKIRGAVRADAVSDVITDLTSEGYTEAGAFIKANY